MPCRDSTEREKSENQSQQQQQSHDNFKRSTGSPVLVIVSSVKKRNNCRTRKRTIANRKKSLVKCIVKVLSPAKIKHRENSFKTGHYNLQSFDNKPESSEKGSAYQNMMKSRTNLKQQLMMEQTRQEEEKEKEMSSSPPTSSSSHFQTSAIKVPIDSSPQTKSPRQIPKNVLMVKSKLANPTPYHVQQSQQRQVHEYLSQSHCFEKIVAQPLSNEESPNIVTGIGESTSPEVEGIEEFWQNFSSIQNDKSSVADSGVDPSLGNIASGTIITEDNGFIEVLNSIPGIGIASCSPDISENAELDYFNGEKLEQFQKDKLKKENHNRIERRRRFKINDNIKELGNLLPGSNDPYYELVKDIRQNKGTILKATVDYVKCLKNEAKKIPKLKNQCRMTEQLNKKLLLRIQALELELQRHNIPISQSTWYPSTEMDINAIVKQEPTYGGIYSSASVMPNNFRPQFSMLGKEQCMQTAKSAPSHSIRTGHPIMQFLTAVKQDSTLHATPPTSSTPSPAAHCPSPTPVFSQFEELMMDDNQPVTGDPMLSSTFCSDYMFIS